MEEHERIDVDSFVQIYRDIDDLFESGDDGEGEEEKEVAVIEEAIQQAEDEQELEIVFQQICDKDGLLTKRNLYQWDEIQKLFNDGLLGEEEFEAIWEKTLKSPGSSDQLDVEGFLSFNVALDDLFVFDDDDDDDDDENDNVEHDHIAVSKPQELSKGMVEGEDLPPGVLFAALANEDNLVGMEELQRWGELQVMLADELLLPLELQSIYDGTPKRVDDMLDEAGFSLFYEAIDALFEDEDDDEEKQPVVSQASQAKTQLLALLAEINRDSERLPCGLESTDREEKLVMDIVNELEKAPSNLVQQKQGNVQVTDVVGSWELLFSSSSAMKFNKGLSGLGGSIPNGKFAGLVQNLQATK